MSLAKVNGFFGIRGAREPLTDNHKNKLKEWCWVTKDNQELRIHKNYLDSYLSLEWKRGRLPLSDNQKNC